MKINKILYLISAFTIFLLSGCSTMSNSIMLGVGSGAAVGAIAGNQSGGGSDRASSGAAIGAAVGALSAYLIHKGLEKRDEKLRRETLLNLERYDVSAPSRSLPSSAYPAGGGHLLTKPSVDVEWIETKVDGDKLIEGHRVWRIIEKPKWIPGEDNKDEKKSK